MERSLKVRVIKENSSKVTLFFVALNRKMPIPKKTFEERVASGEYEVIGDLTQEAEEEKQNEEVTVEEEITAE